MIVPLGFQGVELRRLPVVTFVLMAVLLLCMVAVEFNNHMVQRTVNRVIAAHEQANGTRGYISAEDAEEYGIPDELAKLAGSRPTIANVMANKWDGYEQVEKQSWIIQWGFVPDRMLSLQTLVSLKYLLTPFTALFLHASWWHLLVSLLFLYACGPFLEDRWGRIFFPMFFIGTGVAANLVYWMLSPQATAPLVGPLSAIAAVMGAFLLLHPKRIIEYWFPYVFYLIGFSVALMFIRGMRLFGIMIFVATGKMVASSGRLTVVFGVRAYLALPVMLGLLLLAMNLLPAGYSAVPYPVYIAGFALGFLVAVVLVKSKLDKKFNPQGIDLDDPDHNPILKARVYLEKGQEQKAFDHLKKAFRENPGYLEQTFEFLKLALELEAWSDVKKASEKLFAHALEQDGPELFGYYLTCVRECAPHFPMPVDTAVRVATLKSTGIDEQVENKKTAIDVFEQALNHNQHLTVAQLLQLARLAADLDSDLAHGFLERVSGGRANTRQQQEIEQIKHLIARAPKAGQQAAIVITPEAPPAIPIEADIQPGSSNELPELSFDSFDSFEVSRPSIKAFAARPTAVSARGLDVEMPGKPSRRVAYMQIKAIAVAAIRQPGAKPFVVLDLMIDPFDPQATSLRVLRLQSNQFNPLTLIPNTGKPMAALMKLIKILSHHSKAIQLPESGRPNGSLPSFTTLEDFEDNTYGNSAQTLGLAG